MKLNLFALALLMTPIFAQASAEDIMLARSLMGGGEDVAQVAVAKVRGATDAESLEAGMSNVIVRDLNGDGVNDIMFISEKNPTFRNWQTNEPCDSYDLDKDCEIDLGARTLQVFLGEENGVLFNSFLKKEDFVLGGNDGGIFGDPLEGFEVNNKGSVILSFYGGSAWRWTYRFTMQFRRNDFYLIGKTSEYGWTGDLRFDRKDQNFLTGQVIEQSSKGEGRPTKTKRYKVAVKPLVKVRNLKNVMED